MFIKSIRWRLQLWLAFLLVCILSGFAVTAFQLYRINLFRQIDNELEHRVSVLSADVRSRPGFRPPPPGLGHPPFEPKRGREFERFEGGPGARAFEPGREPLPESVEGGPGGPLPEPGRELRRRGGAENFRGPREVSLSPQTLSLFDAAGTNSFYYVIWSRNGNLLKQSTNALAAIPIPRRLAADTILHQRMRGSFREAYHFTELGDCILAGRSIRADLAALQNFAWGLAGFGGVVLALGLGGGWWLTSRAIRPIEDISAAASRISAGNLTERISVAETDNELGRLAGVLNSTFTRLETAFAQQKQFTADASHELRTPLAVIISEAQTTLARERSAAEYRETVEACLDSAQQMRRLAESLLELARFDAGQEQMEQERFDLAELTQGYVEFIRPLAEKRGIRITCELAPVQALGDARHINRVIANLLTNAIHYNKDNGEIRVSTGLESQGAFLSVTDSGIGIEPEDVPHLFERFYRVDKSRSRAHGGCGLGLAICKAIVDAHNGSIEVQSQPGAGSTFRVTLPVG